MKKLFTLALIGVFSTFLTSCSNTGAADSFPETVNQSKQVETKASSKEAQKDPKEQMIFDEISGDLQGIGYGKEIEYAGKWKLLCHTSWTSSVGNACFETPIGNYNVHWQPLYHNTMPELQPSYDFNPIVFSGSWGCSC
ncbi:hypothetical protein DRF62_02240 [Chryseobacterium piscium]|uniref:Lipoprotein n=1 Tax=Chryseobacterium piscium TaxID=333702 RepID=A0A3D9BU27_9FLAO|nr:hypothetical protein [Chryseobacterium piscium]REC56998.1 hypothetical protein DRF62_02240 [Chryseobacterium piscium]